MVDASRVRRRTFIRMAGTVGAGLPLLLGACTLPNALTPAAPTAGGNQSGATPAAGATRSGKLQLPTYATGPGPKPDFPGNATGLQPGYLNYPPNLVKSVPQPAGLGGDVTVLVSTASPPPPALEQNAAWQAINKDLNANMKLNIVATGPDYTTRVTTTMAGSDLPDMLFLSQVPVNNVPQFLQASCADLTPYLSGDAVKDYPNLAAYPTNSWKPTVFNGSIYAVPNVRAPINYVWYANQNLMDQVGAQPPKSADDFKRLVQEFTRPQANQYGIGAGAPAYGLQNNGRGDVPMLSMFGAPNNWSVDASGKFSKDIESEQFKAALGFVRDLYALGVYWPDPVPLNSVVLKTNYLGGRIGIISTGWISYAIEFWDPGLKLSPPMRPRVFPPFEANGGKPMWHQTQGNAGMMVLKKGTPERTKELLRILNYLSAPFGSQEALLINYGVKDIDYTPDEKGNPVKTPQGNADTSVPWLFVATSLPVLFDSNDATFVPTAYQTEQALMENLVPDPTAGLYSSTDATKGPVLLQKFNDGLGEIVTGTAPIANLTQLLQDWRAGGGDQIRTEYEKSYADAQK